MLVKIKKFRDRNLDVIKGLKSKLIHEKLFIVTEEMRKAHRRKLQKEAEKKKQMNQVADHLVEKVEE